ncbi:hypothetical protein CHS0354_027409 [Potamilus streckersoni]|uniref:Uncharacterized protein n=1 Tax=Potamilus streckersoni TaxID=2493646 RepID=A0AAE0SQE2_9BIVA|nr:hypothetical protein CHS0354_027409 [Potamilus streckersoni]
MIENIEIGNKQVWLIGTAHISRKSTEEVLTQIEAVNPDSVCVELCETRYRQLTEKQRWQQTDIVKIIRSGQAGLLIASLIMSSFQKKMGGQLGVKPGEEMLSAANAAKDKNIPVVLIDRNIRITLKRTWQQMSFWEKIKIFNELLVSFFYTEQVSEQEIEKLKDQDMLSALMEDVSRIYPKTKQVLIDERDKYMAQKIKDAPGGKVVAVVGAGHMAGIKREINHSHDIQELENVSKKKASLSSQGTSVASSMLIFWVISHVGLAGAGALVAGSSLYTLFTAVLTASFSPFIPIFKVNVLSALTEAYFNKPKMISSLAEDAEFIFSLGNFGIRPGLTTTKALLNALENPEQHPRIIHIAGTNGKGSVLTMLEQLLIASGYSVGSTLSPHLIRLNERFRLNGQDIDDVTLHRLLNQVFDACGITHANRYRSADWKIRPTFFEITIAVAFLLFREHQPDFIIAETGMGGRLDATNVVDSMLQIITPVSLDHEQYLGYTPEAIADEKAGIIKPGKTVVFGKQTHRVLARLEEHAARQNTRCYSYKNHFSYQVLNESEELIYKFLTGDKNFIKKINFPALRGAHQLDNLAVSLTAYLLSAEEQKQLSEDKISSVLKKIKFRGRMEQICDNPPVICDGAHNQDGMDNLFAHLSAHFSGKSILLAVGKMADKKFEDIIKRSTLNITLQPLQISYKRAIDAGEYYKILQKTGKKTLPPASIPAFTNHLFTQKSGSADSYNLYVVCGSLYLLGEFYACYEAYYKNRSGENTAPFRNTNI